MNRKEFLQNSLFALTGSLLPGGYRSLAKEQSRITILYTNDTHGRVEPFPDSSIRHAGLGGMSRRLTLIRRIREDSPYSLLLDAGDALYGNPWSHLHGGEAILKLMSRMGYDAMCLGDRDFDRGVEDLARIAPAAQFPFLCANYRVKETVLEPFVRQFILRDLAGVRIGIFGLGLPLAGIIEPELYGDLRFGEPLEWAASLVRYLQERYNCSYIICLSHLGYRYEDDRVDDLKLASSVEGIDLIIGGHTHTFLDEPQMIEGPNGWQTLVTQAGYGGTRLGRVDLQPDSEGGLNFVGYGIETA